MVAAGRVSRTHRGAVTRMLRATGLANVPEEAPLVALLKDLAKELDEGAGVRTRLQYLSALKDVRRALDGGRRPSRQVRGTAEPAAVKKAAEESIAEAAAEAEATPTVLAEFKKKRGIAS